jgi:hypothetical protein
MPWIGFVIPGRRNDRRRLAPPIVARVSTDEVRQLRARLDGLTIRDAARLGRRLRACAPLTRTRSAGSPSRSPPRRLWSPPVKRYLRPRYSGSDCDICGDVTLHAVVCVAWGFAGRRPGGAVALWAQTYADRGFEEQCGCWNGCSMDKPTTHLLCAPRTGGPCA